MPIILPTHLTQTVHTPFAASKVSRLPAGPAAVRLLDCDINNQWQRVEVRRQAYAWGDMDQLAAMCRARGLGWIDCILGTPSFYATSTKTDAYGFKGGASMPNDLSALGRFAYLRAMRFKDLLKAVEPWNEPWGYFEPTTPPLGQENVFVADWDKAVQVAATVFFAVKAASQSIRVLTPSMLGHHPNDWADYVAAGGMEWADDLAIHCYGGDVPVFDATLRNARELLDANGYADKGIALTECGQQPLHKPRFLSLTQAQQTREWANSILLAASYGCSSFVTYSEDPPQETEEQRLQVYPMSKNYRTAADLVRPHLGKTIRKASAWSSAAPAWVIGGRSVVI